MLTTIQKTFDTFATTSTSITLRLAGIGIFTISKSTASACGLSIGIKKIYEKVINKYDKNKKQYEQDQQKIRSFDNLYRKSLQDNLIDKNENEYLCNTFNKSLVETKNGSFS